MKQYKLLNEGITEIINLEIMKQEWSKHKSLKDLVKPYKEQIAYEPVVERVERIITNMQERIPNKNIKQLFIKNYFTGNTEPIELMNRLYKNQKKEIAQMHPYSRISI